MQATEINYSLSKNEEGVLDFIKQPKVIELSYAEFLDDTAKHTNMVNHFFSLDRTKFIHEIKNIQHHSFRDQCIFDNEFFDEGRVTYKYGVLPNHISIEEWDEDGGYTDTYPQYLDAVCIPLKISRERDIEIDQARLVIAAAEYKTALIAIQTRVIGSKYWGTHYCEPHMVLRTIHSLIGQ